MKTLTLRRIVENTYGMFSALFDGDEFLCTALERPWKNNDSEVSCIPPAPGEEMCKYLCKRGTWPKHGETFEVTGVKGRTDILFHKGNYQGDSMGCILLGSGFALINGQLAISASGDAYAWFHRHLKGENEFTLIVKAAT